MSYSNPWFSPYINMFLDAHANDEKPSIWDYWDKFGTQDDDEFLHCLFQEDLRAILNESEASEKQSPWFCDYLATGRLWMHRALACNAWTEVLYRSGDDSLADSLGLLHFGPYRADRIAGIGGFGTVLHACDNDNTHVAIKLPHRNELAFQFIDQEIAMVKRLPAAEGFPRVLASDTHPLVSKYMITPWVDGVSLTQWLRDNPLDIDRNPSNIDRLEVSKQLTILVCMLESNTGIYHGDLSPDNILISDAQGISVSLIDFASAACGFLKRGNHPIFTRMYAAPELLTGKETQPSNISDIWSLSAIVFELLMGFHPFGSSQDTLDPSDEEYLGRVLNTKLPSSLGSIWRELPWYVTTGLQPNPAVRKRVKARDILTHLTQPEQILLHERRSPSSARANELCLSYLGDIKERYGTMVIPLLKDGDDKARFSVEPLMVELPLVLHSNPERFHSEQNEYSSHAESIRLANKEDIQSTTLLERCSNNNATAIVGVPGSGKSTLLRWVAYHMAQRCRDAITGNASVSHSGNPAAPALPDVPLLPIMLVCRDLSKIDHDCTLSDLIDLQLEALAYSATQKVELRNEFLSRLESNQAILLVDGLDELPNHNTRIRVAELLNSIAANHKYTILISARSVGYKHIQVYLNRIAHVVIDKIPPDTREAYVRGFGSQIPDMEIEDLVLRVRADDRLGQLCESMLMLVLVAQISAILRPLPDREHEVYQRAIELMIQNQYLGERPPVGPNELYPHLEHLASYMHANQLKTLWDIHVVEQFEEARALESSEFDRRSMSIRAADELLNDIVRRIQILNIAGTDKDPTSRRMRDRVQFMHQRFQEYMAGMVSLGVTGDAVADKETVPDKLTGLKQIIGKWKDGTRPIVTRPIKLYSTNKHVEYTISSEDYDTVPLWVAQLTSEQPDLVDDAIRILLPDDDSSPDISRALSVLALRCLGDEPEVSTETATAIIRCALENASIADCTSNNPITLFDDAITLVSKGKYFGILEQVSIEFLLRAPDSTALIYIHIALRIVYCKYIANNDIMSTLHNALQILKIDKTLEQLTAALLVIEAYYSTSDRSDIYNSNTEHANINTDILDLLLRVGQKNRGRIGAIAIYALSWSTDSIPEVKRFSPRPSNSLRKAMQDIITDDDRDPIATAYACRVLGYSEGTQPALEQEDWIYDWAVIADGGIPQIQLKEIRTIGEDAEIGLLAHTIESNPNHRVRSQAALALARMGHHIPIMYSPLFTHYCDIIQNPGARDEALLGLVSLNDSKVWQRLIEFTHTDSEDEPYDLTTRSFLGLMSCDNPEIMRQEILVYNTKDDSNNFMQSYAYVLAGMKSRRGREYLAQLVNHENIRISKAAYKALKKAIEWGMWPDDLPIPNQS